MQKAHVVKITISHFEDMTDEIKFCRDRVVSLNEAFAFALRCGYQIPRGGRN